MRALIASFLLFLLPVSGVSADDHALPPSIQAKSAVLLAEGGELIYEKDAELMLPIASTTKIMTALVALDRCNAEDIVEIRADCCGIEGSSMYLKSGDRISVRDLLTGLLLVSGNDAACALAVYCAGSIEAFSALMNEKAAELGMSDTHFTNPHGLSEAGHYSTAYDLALLMLAAMREDVFAEIIGTKSAKIGDQILLNHNKLLSLCPGCLGGKTGYTSLAGRCLVSCAERNGARLVCVTLCDPDDWNDHIKLYDWAFSAFRTLSVDPASFRCAVPLFGGSDPYAYAVPAGNQQILLPSDSIVEWETELPFYAFAPVRWGVRAGALRLYVNGEFYDEFPLFYEDDYPIDQVKHG